MNRGLEGTKGEIYRVDIFFQNDSLLCLMEGSKSRGCWMIVTRRSLYRGIFCLSRL